MGREPRWSVGSDLKRFHFPLQSRKRSFSQQCALLSSQIPPVLCTMRPPAPKPALPMVLVPAQTKKGIQGWSSCTEFKDSETLLPAEVFHPLLLQHRSYPDKLIYCVLSDFSKPGEGPVIYGSLELERNRISFLCNVPGFLCVPVLVKDFHLPLKSRFDRDGMT